MAWTQVSVLAEGSAQYAHGEITIPAADHEEPTRAFSAAAAFDYLENGAVAWTKRRECVSCHTNGTYLLIRPIMTPSVGAPDRKIRDFFVRQLEEIRRLDPEKAKTQGTRAAQVIYTASVTHSRTCF